MMRALLLSAIIGAVAYHYGVEAGKKEARAEISLALPAAPHHHGKNRHATGALSPEENPADGALDRADNGTDSAAEKEAHLLEHKATQAVTSTIKAQAANTLHSAATYLEKKLKGDKNNPESAPEDQASGR